LHSSPEQARPPSERTIGSSPIGSDDGCLEATLVARPGEQPRVRLSRLSWGDGLGWFAQHSLDLDLDEVRELARLLDRVPASLETVAAAPVPISLPAYRARKARAQQRP
jgi:hypothetical protein